GKQLSLKMNRIQNYQWRPKKQKNKWKISPQQKHCVSLRASLASVQNPDEQYFLQNLIASAGLPLAWIGAYNFQGTWLWIDRAGFYYSNWLSLSSVSSYPCAYMRSNAGWSNTNCASTLSFVCSINPTVC
ncbi:hypothetical protein P4O66_013762, partial [Electrophorus voltai]